MIDFQRAVFYGFQDLERIMYFRAVEEKAGGAPRL